MLTGFRLGKFKAFADTQRIPIKPLTLIFGPNSAGKSSLIHGLLLAAHAAETGDLDVHRTALGGDSVDLGGFRQFAHRHEVTGDVELGLQLDVSAADGGIKDLLSTTKEVTMTVTVGRVSDEGDGPSVDGQAVAVTTFELEFDGRSVLRMSRRRGGALQLDRLDQNSQVFHDLIQALVEGYTTLREQSHGDRLTISAAVDNLVPLLVGQVRGLFPGRLVAGPPGDDVEELTAPMFTISRRNRAADLADAVAFWFPRGIDRLLTRLAGAAQDQLRTLRYLGPLRSYPPRHIAFSQFHDPNWVAGGGWSWDVARRDEALRQEVNEWLRDEDRLKKPYELVIRDLVDVGELGRSVEARLFPEAAPVPGRPSTSVEAEGRSHGGRRGRPSRDLLNDPSKLFQAIEQSDVERLPDLVLFDRFAKTAVSHRDVGIGVSQVLPVLVSAYYAREQIVAIEQPEIHLHPALQAELGDVFIRSALGTRRNTFLLETHSEHLILRIMRRMRNTADGELPEGLPPVRPKDVAVLYVQPTGAAAVVRELELDEDGRLLDPWPDGFFEEGFRERFS